MLTAEEYDVQGATRRSGLEGVSFCRFFFQAEDGIRDLTVTGVQTCALPISSLKLGFDFTALRFGERRHGRKRVLLIAASAETCSARGWTESPGNDLRDRRIL